VVCLAALGLAAIAKNIHVSPLSAAIDLCRLVIPLLWVALLPIPSFAAEFFQQVVRHRKAVIVVLAVQIVGLAAGRLIGWQGSYLAGDPLVPPLVFTAALASGNLAGQAVTLILAATLLVGSLKRASWLAAFVVLVLLVLSSWRSLSRPMLARIALLGFVAIFAVLAFAQALSPNGRLIARAESIASSVSQSGRDDAINQRLDEVRVEVDRLLAAPVPAFLVGLSSDNMRLPNGQSTHAIHNTLVFLLLGGGVVWLAALVSAGRKQTMGASRTESILTVIVMATLLDSLGENMALAPSFGLALAIALAQLRRLVPARRGQMQMSESVPR